MGRDHLIAEMMYILVPESMWKLNSIELRWADRGEFTIAPETYLPPPQPLASKLVVRQTHTVLFRDEGGMRFGALGPTLASQLANGFVGTQAYPADCIALVGTTWVRFAEFAFPSPPAPGARPTA
jgi:hypothetical protein